MHTVCIDADNDRESVNMSTAFEKWGCTHGIGLVLTESLATVLCLRDLHRASVEWLRKDYLLRARDLRYECND